MFAFFRDEYDGEEDERIGSDSGTEHHDVDASVNNDDDGIDYDSTKPNTDENGWFSLW